MNKLLDLKLGRVFLCRDKENCCMYENRGTGGPIGPSLFGPDCLHALDTNGAGSVCLLAVNSKREIDERIRIDGIIKRGGL